MIFFKLRGIHAFFVIVMLVAFASAQKKKDTCWHHYQEDPDHINEVYFPHDTDCRFYYQCSAHGRVRMKCQPGMHFDWETHQCGRPDDVECYSTNLQNKK